MQVQAPSTTTLRKYGLSIQEWDALYLAQDGKCPCGKLLEKRICIDHYHCKGWKKMKPDERKKWVRGLCHWQCNFYFLRRGMTESVALGIANYLHKFEARRPK